MRCRWRRFALFSALLLGAVLACVLALVAGDMPIGLAEVFAAPTGGEGMAADIIREGRRDFWQ